MRFFTSPHAEAGYVQNDIFKKYNIVKLVYFEEFGEINYAIEREKQIKSASRIKKEELIEIMNRNWKDLSEVALFF